jgi:hypothetical protein
MRALAALERFLERLVERPSARLFHTRLEPVAILRRVERSMESGRRTTSEGTVVPDRFTVRLNPADLAALGGAAPDLASQTADGALRFARAHGYRLRERPRIDLVPDSSVVAGDLAVDGRFDRARDAAGPATAADVAPADLGATMVYRPPTIAGPVARLRVLEPTGADRTVELGSLLTIGRAPDNGLVLADSRASRYHARIQVRQSLVVYVDLESRNGSLVNGLPVREVALGAGDEIRIGDTRLRVEAMPPR